MSDSIEAESPDIAGLLEVNRLCYQLPPSLSVAASRSLRDYPAQQQVYTMGDTLTFVVSSGNAFCDPKNSFIAFDVVFNDSNPANNTNLTVGGMNGIRMPAHCGWMQVFQRYILTHSSGVELDRQNDAVGEFNQIEQYYGHSKARRIIQGSLWGHNESENPGSVQFDSNQAYEDAQMGKWWLPILPGGVNTASGPGAPGPPVVNPVDNAYNLVPQPGQMSDFPDGRTPAAIVGGVLKYQWDGRATGATPGPYWSNDSAAGGGAGNIVRQYPDFTWLQKNSLAGQPTRPSNPERIKGIYYGGFIEDEDLTGVRIKVVLPLSMVAPFFDHECLAPPYMMAGLRIDLSTYTKERFFQTVPVPAPIGAGVNSVNMVPWVWTATQSVTIENPRIHIESFIVSESVSRKIAQISSTRGLEWNWAGVHQSSYTTEQATTAIQVNRTLSRADCIIVKTRTAGNLTSASANAFASDSWDYPETIDQTPTANNIPGQPVPIDTQNDGTMTAFQVQMGALYVPMAPITSTRQFLHSALKTFMQFRRNDEIGGVPLWDFSGMIYSQPYSGNLLVGSFTTPALAISAVPLETSSTLQQSGMAISASRTAVINMTFKFARTTANPRRIDVFVCHTKLASYFADGTVVRS
jgi:hypothetical protein